MIGAIQIGDVEYKLKYSLRALIIFEKIMGKSFSPGDLTNEVVLYFSIVKAANPNSDLEFDQFFAYLDDNMKALYSLREWLTAAMKEVVGSSEEEDTADDKKKD